MNNPYQEIEIADKWANNPIKPKPRTNGVWMGGGKLSKNEHGHWVREGRLIKKYYTSSNQY